MHQKLHLIPTLRNKKKINLNLYLNALEDLLNNSNFCSRLSRTVSALVCLSSKLSAKGIQAQKIIQHSGNDYLNMFCLMQHAGNTVETGHLFCYEHKGWEGFP